MAWATPNPGKYTQLSPEEEERKQLIAEMRKEGILCTRGMNPYTCPVEDLRNLIKWFKEKTNK